MPTRKLDHPALDHLESTPEILRLLMARLRDEHANLKPGPGRWSVAEVLEHLSHLEAHCFRARLDRMLTAEAPELACYDEKAFDAEGTYSGRDPEESFAHWEEQRADNVEFICELHAGVLTRTGQHPVYGTITVDNLLNDWACHDLGHVRQIAELVRAEMYYPGLGPLQAKYSLHP